MTSGRGAFSALHYAFQRLKVDMLQLFFRQAAIKTAALSAGPHKLSLQTTMKILPLELM
jgi:hypothetical protein